MTPRSGLWCCAAALALAGCASGPVAPDWQANAASALDAAVEGYLDGDARAQALHADLARREIASTGRPALMARAELVMCAAAVASLVFEPCVGYERLAADAEAAERAYAQYLAAQPLSRDDIERLPAAQRPAAASVAGGDATVAGVQSIDDPLARLIAVAVLFQAGKASPDMIASAADTASAQGWRRPLLAWLQVQAKLAEAAGNTAEAQRLRRRIDLALNAR